VKSRSLTPQTMSIIHTCRLNDANPLDYLAALREHAGLALKNPSQWLPWNYRKTLQALQAPQAPNTS